jgi:rhodanese-related sulfurtransferase
MKNLLRPFVFVVGVATLLSCNSTPEGVTDIDSETYNKLEAEKNTVVIDVRTPDEVSNGYIKGADLFIDFNGGNFENEIEKLDRSKKYIVYCASGNRSAKASKVFVDKGFKEIYNLTGGIGSWEGDIVQ